MPPRKVLLDGWKHGYLSNNNKAVLTDRDIVIADSPNTTLESFLENFEGGGGGTFDGDHNDLDGRDALEAHPHTAISGLGTAAVASAGAFAQANHGHSYVAISGLGTIATQDSNNVSISGGTVSGITDLAVADGGTGASTATSARLNLGTPHFHGTETIGAVSFSGTTLTVASVTYWYKGTRIVVSSPITIDVSLSQYFDVNKFLYIYFDDATAVLKCGNTFWDLKEKIPIVTIDWNGTNGATCREWHNYTRDVDWHINAHLSIGCRYGDGFDLLYPTVGSPTRFALSDGYTLDEDIISEVEDIDTNTNNTLIRLWHLASADVFTFTNSGFIYGTVSGDPQYLDTDTYALTNVPDNSYACYWIYASPDIERPIYSMPSYRNAAYGNLPQARAETPPALTGYGALRELRLLWRFIFKGDGTFVEYKDYRTESSLPAGSIASTTAGAVSFSNTETTLSATNVQDAIEELDAKIESTTEQWVDAPANNNSTGLKGQMAYLGGYLYVCVSANVWVRYAVETSFTNA